MSNAVGLSSPGPGLVSAIADDLGALGRAWVAHAEQVADIAAAASAALDTVRGDPVFLGGVWDPVPALGRRARAGLDVGRDITAIAQAFRAADAGWNLDVAVAARSRAPLALPAGRSTDPGQRVLAVAASQIGYREGRGNRTPFGRWYGMDGNPWCAMFVSWCLAAAGSPLPPIDGASGSASVASLRRWGRRTGRLVTHPQPGDLLLIDHGGGAGHMGIVERVEADGTVHTIEGNTDADGGREGREVARRTREIRHNMVLLRPNAAS